MRKGWELRGTGGCPGGWCFPANIGLCWGRVGVHPGDIRLPFRLNSRSGRSLLRGSEVPLSPPGGGGRLGVLVQVGQVGPQYPSLGAGAWCSCGNAKDRPQGGAHHKRILGPAKASRGILSLRSFVIFKTQQYEQKKSETFPGIRSFLFSNVSSWGGPPDPVLPHSLVRDSGHGLLGAPARKSPSIKVIC